MVFSPEKCEQGPRAYATGVRPRTPNSRDCFTVSECRILKEQGWHPYHVQWVQALQPNNYIRRTKFCEWVIHMYVDQPDFLRIILFTD
ncbi:unnamed protein product [Tenebrio molitor]|nr:unnamed protein product [Tenebrio molitor]